MAGMTAPHPFLRWVGGKAGLVSRLARFTRLQPGATYFEPFLGAGSLFFSVRPSKAVLNDLNHDLIHCYECVRSRPDLVWRHLRSLLHRQSREEYIALRDEFNASEASYRRSALLIYLNKTCFNGIWRVNRSGAFNVPYGAKEHAGFPTRSQLILAAASLDSARLKAGDFEAATTDACAGDLVYLDPPYLPLSPTAFFRHYTPGRFSVEDHERVALLAADLAARGANVMVTEGDSKLVRKWYKEFRVSEVAVRRSVSCDAQRLDASELIITSYPLERGTGRRGS